MKHSHLITLLVGTTASPSTPRAPVYYAGYVETLPSMKGKTVAITGCSRGLGFVTAKTCAAKGARVLMLNRESPRAREALAEVAAAATDSPPEHIACDLLDLSSVRAAAESIRGRQTLDVLCLNGGVMFAADRPSKDGFDVTMATNLLSHFALTCELLPLLETTATARGEARVVSVSSASGFSDPPFDATYYEPGSGGKLGGEEGARARYHQSKLGQFLFTAELDRRLRARGSRVKALACQPGVCATDMYVDVHERVFNPGRPADRSRVASVEDGSLAQLTCICADVDSGECWGPQSPPEPCLPERFDALPPLVLVDEPSQAAFWAACERAVGDFEV